ncbi:uncharacterized protein LOC131958281 isoform X2 [Physella acuta]|uniref:uncharacterized protein LOC131958281 isoform X2 n=1 Tax=Physella acuta TaxID=109671 RepID=UPI0027DE3667|nr:uncharacterized protein LOC131958281 isoform X2 [Physella acuta]
MIEYARNVFSKVASDKFLEENGIIATLDGYYPKCPGCVLFHKEHLLVYGKFHVPNDKLHLIGGFNGLYVEICWGDIKNEPCSDPKTSWYPYCEFSEALFKECNATNIRTKSKDLCYCEDSRPKRWNALLLNSLFTLEDMAVRFTFHYRGIWEPVTNKATLNITDLIKLGHIVHNRVLSPGQKIEQARYIRTYSVAASTSFALCSVTVDLLLDMVSVAFAYAVVGFVLS